MIRPRGHVTVVVPTKGFLRVRCPLPPVHVPCAAAWPGGWEAGSGQRLPMHTPQRAISSYVGVGIPDFQVGSRSSSMLPLGSKK